MSILRSAMSLSRDDASTMAPRQVRTTVVSAVRIHGDAVVAALRGAEGIEVTGNFLSGHDTATSIATLSAAPDAILFDDSIVANLPLIQNIHAQLPSARLIALGVDESEEAIV